MIALVMLLLIILGQRFGVSSSFRALCSIGGAGKKFAYFKYDWKSHSWLLTFIVGSMIGGGIASTILASPEPVQISEATIQDLQEIGIQHPKSMEEGAGFLPTDIFKMENLTSPMGIIVIILGGFMICLLYTSPSPRDS